MKTKIIMVIALLIGIAFVPAFRAAAYLATTIVVTPSNMDGWAEDSTPPADVLFVNGPNTPPAGSGSAQFTVGPDGFNDAELRNGLYDGLNLGDITEIDYWTYVTSNGGGLNNSCQAVYIILNVDQDNNGTIDDNLFFEPCYQNGSYTTLPYSGPIPNQCGSNPNCVSIGVWQQWDAAIGGWWSGNDSAGGPPLTTLADYATEYPNAVIRNAVSPTQGGLRLTAGFGSPGSWGNFNGNVDAFTINGITYDFELVNVPSNREQCKNGGWDNFTRTDGTGFKNQGDCIQYVNTQK